MFDIPFSKMIQPRLAATYAYNGSDTLYASFARYNPAAEALAARGVAGSQPDRRSSMPISMPTARSSRPSLWAPRPESCLSKTSIHASSANCWVGTARQFTPSWSGRLYARTRRGSNFWEDTNNTARTAFNPPQGIPREPLHSRSDRTAGRDR